MTSNEQAPFDPHAFAAQIVPPSNPYKGYDARQAELGDKDHPWAHPVEETSSTFASPLKRPSEFKPEDYKNPPFVARSPEEQVAQDAINATGKALARAALQQMRVKRGDI